MNITATEIRRREKEFFDELDRKWAKVPEPILNKMLELAQKASRSPVEGRGCV